MWQQVLQTQLQVPFRNFTTDYEFDSSLLILSAFATSDFSDNYRIGRIRPIYKVNNNLFTKGAFKTIRLQKQFISFLEVPYLYKLEFVWYVWLPQLTLTFYQPGLGDVPSVLDLKVDLIENRTNIAYLQQQLDRVENKIDNYSIQ
jgi:hypothetical protein